MGREGPSSSWLEAMEHLVDRVGIRVVGKTTDISEALDLAATQDPDILLVGYGGRDRDLDVVECLRRAHELRPRLKGVVLSASDERRDVEAAFAAGASAFCRQNRSSGRLDGGNSPDVRALDLSGALAEGLATSARPRVDRPRADTSRTRDPPARRGGDSNAQLARMVWITEQTVKFHLSNIYRKLNVANRTGASR